jgi:hypothetical protein
MPSVLSSRASRLASISCFSIPSLQSEAYLTSGALLDLRVMRPASSAFRRGACVHLSTAFSQKKLIIGIVRAAAGVAVECLFM